MSTDDLICAINDSGADFLVVALGAAKGQAWIEHNLARLTVPVVSHLGAVVNFAAGSLVRAPVWIQRAGLEWVWRIKEEPNLWRRYWSDGRTLLSLLGSRLIPYAVWLQFHKPDPKKIGTLAFLAQGSSGVNRLSVTGDICGEMDSAHLAALDQAADCGVLVVDFRAAQILGPGFWAQLLLLGRRAQAHGNAITLDGLTPAVRRQMGWNGVDYLLGDAGLLN